MGKNDIIVGRLHNGMFDTATLDNYYPDNFDNNPNVSRQV